MDGKYISPCFFTKRKRIFHFFEMLLRTTSQDSPLSPSSRYWSRRRSISIRSASGTGIIPFSLSMDFHKSQTNCTFSSNGSDRSDAVVFMYLLTNNFGLCSQSNQAHPTNSNSGDCGERAGFGNLPHNSLFYNEVIVHHTTKLKGTHWNVYCSFRSFLNI